MVNVTQTTRPVTDPAKVSSALSLFKITAIIAGLAMFVLITEMVLKYGFDNDELSWWSPVHGVIFIIERRTAAEVEPLINAARQ